MSGAVNWTYEETDLQALREGISRVLDTEADRLQLHAHLDGKVRLDRLLWEKAAELGWLAVGLPEHFGGLGFGPRGLEILFRELGRQAAPGSFIATLSAAQALAEVADDATLSEWLPRIVQGECQLAVPAQIGAAADGWLIGAEDAEVALAPLADGAWGLLPLKGATPVDVWDRTRTVLRADLAGAEPIVRLPGEATARALSRHLSLAIANDSIAGAREITDRTIAYMKERVQFDKVIASFQALKHRVADMMTLVVSGEEFVSLGVERVAAGDDEADIWADLAKARATDSFVHVAGECLQLHGGVGFTWEFDPHVYLKRARLNEMLVGTNPAMRDRAADGLASSLRVGGQPLELAL
jgi:alkylation response protein AidB-like acyl-CoA dehydrogenase